MIVFGILSAGLVFPFGLFVWLRPEQVDAWIRRRGLDQLSFAFRYDPVGFPTRTRGLLLLFGGAAGLAVHRSISHLTLNVELGT